MQLGLPHFQQKPMIRTQEDLLQAIDQFSFPEVFREIISGSIPEGLSGICDPPLEFSYPIFFRHPEAFPESGQLLILWDTNQSSITGFLMDDQIFIKSYLEDGPEVDSVIADNYQQFACHILRQYFNSFSSVETAALLAQRFEFKYWEEMLQVYTEAAHHPIGELTKQLDLFSASLK